MAKFPSYIYRGDARTFPFTLTKKIDNTDLCGNILDPTLICNREVIPANGTIYFTARDRDRNIIIQSQDSRSGDDLLNPDGRIYLTLTDEDTDVSHGTYSFDVRFVDTVGNPSTLLPRDGDDPNFEIRQGQTDI